jgi:20S proteasome subunit alpha 7
MEAARIIYVAHEDSDGPTKGKHMPVPQELFEEADKAARKSLENDDDEDEEGGEEMQE